MKFRLAWLIPVSATVLAIACTAAYATSDFTQAEKHAAEERALRAQIEQMDDEIQKLDTQLYALEHDKTAADPARTAKQDALREQVHRMNREEDLILDRLNDLEKHDPPGTSHAPADHAAAAAERQASAAPMIPASSAPPPALPTPPQAMPAPPAPVALAPARGPSVRSAADPAIYDKAADSPVGSFSYYPYKWVPVGTRQVAIFNTYDDAYLLDLAGDCPTLLTTEKLVVENFSTHVIAGKDGVIADGVRCPITVIRPLHVNRLPR